MRSAIEAAAIKWFLTAFETLNLPTCLVVCYVICATMASATPSYDTSVSFVQSDLHTLKQLSLNTYSRSNTTNFNFVNKNCGTRQYT